MSAKSEIAKAINQSLKRWKALARYRDDSRIEIDHNAAERAAAIYSLVETAQLNGLDPQTDLRVLLTHVAAPPVNSIDELLPWDFAQAAQERRPA